MQNITIKCALSIEILAKIARTISKKDKNAEDGIGKYDWSLESGKKMLEMLILRTVRQTGKCLSIRESGGCVENIICCSVDPVGFLNEVLDALGWLDLAPNSRKKKCAKKTFNLILEKLARVPQTTMPSDQQKRIAELEQQLKFFQEKNAKLDTAVYDLSLDIHKIESQLYKVNQKLQSETTYAEELERKNKGLLRQLELKFANTKQDNSKDMKIAELQSQLAAQSTLVGKFQMEMQSLLEQFDEDFGSKGLKRKRDDEENVSNKKVKKTD